MEYYLAIEMQWNTDTWYNVVYTLKTLCSVKEASPRNLHIIWLHLDKIPRRVKSVETERLLGVYGWVGREGWGATWYRCFLMWLGYSKINCDDICAYLWVY